MSTFETIRFETGDDAVATITLNRPDQLNSFNEQMAKEMAETWATVRDTDAIHAVVLRAAGERAFCTGIDVKQGAWWTDRNVWNHEDPGASLG
ncbi:MAG: enoyl-CoA hydratase/isomerase family protein, partial [Candidatus Binatia bacterium]